MFKRLSVAVVFLLFSACSWSAEYWIDVRIPGQFYRYHLDEAVNVPLFELETKIADVVPNKDDVVHLYCNTGNQSSQAKLRLAQMGYQNVIDEGGLRELVEKGHKGHKGP